MSLNNPTLKIFDRYLRILGLTKRNPGREALSELVAAHLTRVPFENVSKLYYRKREGRRSLLELEHYLDGIERYNFGGTCYSNNYYLHLLLVHLGYEVKLCGADMNNPDVHLVNIVSVEGREFLVDVGYAAPFMKPLPRDLDHDFEIRLGRDRCVLKPRDKAGCSRLELYRDGELKHGYIAKPIPRGIEHFAGVIEHSYTNEATFMNALLLIRFYRNYSFAIHNLTLIESRGREFNICKLTNRNELSHVIEKHFGILREIAAEAVAEINIFDDAWN
jgi:arylamine N-acetyltransferase